MFSKTIVNIVFLWGVKLILAETILKPLKSWKEVKWEICN